MTDTQASQPRPNFLDKVKSERQGERFIALDNLRSTLDLTFQEQVELESRLKEHAADYWLRHGGNPADLVQGRQLALMRTLTSSTGTVGPAFSQALIIDAIEQGIFKPREGLLTSSFFKLPQEEQKAIIDGLISSQPLPTPQGKTGMVEQLAIRAGLKDEVFR